MEKNIRTLDAYEEKILGVQCSIGVQREIEKELVRHRKREANVIENLDGV